MPNAPWVICRWHITEEEIKVAVVTAFNKLVTERAGANVASRSCASTSASYASEEIAANARLVRQTLCDTAELERYEKAKARFDEVMEAIAERSAKGERLAGFIRTLEAQTEPVAEFDERLWGTMVDYVTVGVDGGMTVVFRDGTDILV